MTGATVPKKDSPRARSEPENYWVCHVFSEKTLAHLLRLEKERRGLHSNRRCFVGISDLANYDHRTDEREYFSAYLYDGSVCDSRLRLISERPRLQTDWLTIVPQPSFEDRQRLFLEERKSLRHRPSYLIDRFGREYPVNEALIADYLAGRIEVGRWGFSSVPHEPKHRAMKASEKRAAEGHLVYPQLPARQRGLLDEDLLAEQYPTFQWHFDWRQYVVVGMPDGINEDFVYEFKSTTDLRHMKLVAERQADLYGYFFRREHKRIQIRDVSAGRVLTFSSRVDRANAEATLERYDAVLKAG